MRGDQDYEFLGFAGFTGEVEQGLDDRDVAEEGDLIPFFGFVILDQSAYQDLFPIANPDGGLG